MSAYQQNPVDTIMVTWMICFESYNQNWSQNSACWQTWANILHLMSFWCQFQHPLNSHQYHILIISGDFCYIWISYQTYCVSNFLIANVAFLFFPVLKQRTLGILIAKYCNVRAIGKDNMYQHETVDEVISEIIKDFVPPGNSVFCYSTCKCNYCSMFG